MPLINISTQILVTDYLLIENIELFPNILPLLYVTKSNEQTLNSLRGKVKLVPDILSPKILLIKSVDGRMLGYANLESSDWVSGLMDDLFDLVNRPSQYGLTQN